MRKETEECERERQEGYSVLSKYRHIGPRRAGCRSQDRNSASNADGGVVSSPAKPVSHGDPHSRSLAWSWCDSSSLALVMHEAWVVNCNQWQPPIRHLSAHPQKSCESILTAYCLQSSHSGSPKIKQKVAVPITGQPCGGFECGFPGAQNESLFSAQRLTIQFHALRTCLRERQLCQECVQIDSMVALVVCYLS